MREEIDRILQLWAQARARFGGTGDFLFGDWCAADMMYAPVVTRFITYGVPVPNFAGVYMKAVLSHPHVAEWIDKAQDEPWVIEQYEVGMNEKRPARTGPAWRSESLSESRSGWRFTISALAWRSASRWYCVRRRASQDVR